MTLYSTEPEYILEEKSEKMHHSFRQSKDTKLTSMVEVAAELRLLSQELTMSVDILGRIRESLVQLQLAVES